MRRDLTAEEKEKRKGARRSLDQDAAEIKASQLQGVPLPYFEEMKEIFKLFDADGSGAIDPKEIREQMTSLGFKVDNTTIYQLISDLDSDGSQKLEFDEFFGMLRDTLQIHKPAFSTREQLSEIFDFLDDLEPSNRDGRIDTSNLRRLANVLGDNISDKDIELMIKGADKDGKGFVLPEDFYQLMVGCAERMDQKEEPCASPDIVYVSDASSQGQASVPGTPRSPTKQTRPSTLVKLKTRENLNASDRKASSLGASPSRLATGSRGSLNAGQTSKSPRASSSRLEPTGAQLEGDRKASKSIGSPKKITLAVEGDSPPRSRNSSKQ
jgi:Ca2+-binding EF-hand superfamily protein